MELTTGPSYLTITTRIPAHRRLQIFLDQSSTVAGAGYCPLIRSMNWRRCTFWERLMWPWTQTSPGHTVQHINIESIFSFVNPYLRLPVNDWVIVSVDQSVSKWMSHLVSRRDSQWMSKWFVSQPVSTSIIHLVCQFICLSVCQSASQSVSQSVSQLASQLVNEWVIYSVSETLWWPCEPVSQYINPTLSHLVSQWDSLMTLWASQSVHQSYIESFSQSVTVSW